MDDDCPVCVPNSSDIYGPRKGVQNIETAPELCDQLGIDTCLMLWTHL